MSSTSGTNILPDVILQDLNKSQHRVFRQRNRAGRLSFIGASHLHELDVKKFDHGAQEIVSVVSYGFLQPFLHVQVFPTSGQCGQVEYEWEAFAFQNGSEGLR